MEHTVYNTTLHLVEIEKVKPMGNIGTMTEVWLWEITMADKGNIYKGKAAVQNKKIHLPWMELQSATPLTEMIDACKRYMENH
ncbi:MAG TPA: hypothetical protein K8V56_21460 [Sporosarcina psychrophila]|uniref:Uncharacterized protein n=1 Tax=Sporosarcina psychrophila TaxID=1476 RepID=A0A921G404_SPOPS|nr:hypothetical protein [Sporosarcina psychrophila]